MKFWFLKDLIDFKKLLRKNYTRKLREKMLKKSKRLTNSQKKRQKIRKVMKEENETIFEGKKKKKTREKN